MNLSDKIVIYRTADGQTTVDVRMDGDTVWLSQAQMAELFQTDRTSILRHIKNIYIVKQNWFAKKPSLYIYFSVPLCLCVQYKGLTDFSQSISD